MNDNDPDPMDRLKKALKSAGPKKQKAKASRPKRQATTYSNADFVVRGNGNIVANKVNVSHGPQIVRPKITPGDAHITPQQALTLKELVESLVTVGGAVKRNKPTYASVYGALNKKMGAAQYQLILRDRYPEALAFLTAWRGRMLSMKSAPTKMGADFRNLALRFIHARCREFPNGEARREAYMMRTFGSASLSTLSDADLKRLRAHIMGWRARS